MAPKLRYQYRYRAGAFSGVRSFSGVATGGSRNCGVFACTGDTKDTCGLRFQTYEANTTAIFEELAIVATVPTSLEVSNLTADDSVVFPVSMTVSIMPLETKDYNYTKTIIGNVTTHSLSLNKISAELYSFALWGRVYETDGEDAHPPVVDSSAIKLISRGLIMFVLGLFVYNQI